MNTALTFDNLARANAIRLPLFKNAKGELAHAQDDWSINDWAVALAGEVGELCNLLKKVRRGDFTLREAKVEISSEIGDIQIYLDLLATKCEINLGQATRFSFNQKSIDKKIEVFI